MLFKVEPQSQKLIHNLLKGLVNDILVPSVFVVGVSLSGQTEINPDKFRITIVLLQQRI